MPNDLPFSPGRPWLAPLAGFSDLPFRILCRRLGCSVACTEMVSAKGLVYGSPGTGELLSTGPDDMPLVVQLFGAEPEYLSRATALLMEQGFTHFDLNAGCPVKKVAKTGSGAALLKEPLLLEQITRAMVRLAGPGRVGVKIRLGWDSSSVNYLEVGARVEQAGAAWVTLHPRLARQGFSGSADWESLRRLKQLLSIPVLGSGDLFTAEDGLRCLQLTGIDAIMFARGALHDPAVFARFSRLVDKGSNAFLPTTAWLLKNHGLLSIEHGSGAAALLKMRTIAPRFIRYLPGAKSLRMAFASCSSWDEYFDLVERVDAFERGHPARTTQFEEQAR
jgi:tRNA-dihydrouridine synthase B